MDKEVSQLEKLGTYSLGDLPADRKAIGCRWVFTIKRDADGNILKYKARLVAQGLSQIPSQDFTATHAPVMRLESFRTLIAIAAYLRLDLHQVVVVGAYLNAPLTERIFMRQIPGFEDGTHRVLELKKSLYGLKQSGRYWNHAIDGALTKDLKFTRSSSDPCVYFRITPDEFTALGIHVDDMIIISLDAAFQHLKDTLSTRFDITDLGIPRLFVGIQIECESADSITIHQSHYVDVILERFNMLDCNPASTPLDPKVNLIPAIPTTNTASPADFSFQVLIGSLMYAAIGTRPDIAFTVQCLSQFNSKPTPTHYTAAKHVLRYLKATRTFGITYGGDDELILTGFTDADWGQNIADRRSVSDYAYTLNSDVISWSSKRQTTTALSTMKAEYLALSHATKEALWLRTLLTELDFAPDGPIDICSDNMAAISFSHDHQFHARSKHIDIRHHFIRENVLAGIIKIPHCSSEENCADILTKPLARTLHANQLALLNLSTR